MKEIEPEVLNHIQNTLVKFVWEKWITEGKTRLILLNDEMQTCNPQCR